MLFTHGLCSHCLPPGVTSPQGLCTQLPGPQGLPLLLPQSWVCYGDEGLISPLFAPHPQSPHQVPEARLLPGQLPDHSSHPGPAPNTGPRAPLHPPLEGRRMYPSLCSVSPPQPPHTAGKPQEITHALSQPSCPQAPPSSEASGSVPTPPVDRAPIQWLLLSHFTSHHVGLDKSDLSRSSNVTVPSPPGVPFFPLLCWKCHLGDASPHSRISSVTSSWAFPPA